MADFRFLHAADIHLDSPLHGLAHYEGVPLDEVRGATRAAFDRLIAFALEEAVDFVVIAGDLFDGDWKDMGTGLYFARAMGRLSAAGIPAFILAGNHDAASVLTRSLPWPDSVRVFGARRPNSFALEQLGVVLHGQSFHTQHVYEDLAAGYPPPAAGAFNIGVLHTALGGAPGHAPYAPASLAALQAKGYDYWALGHVHDFQQFGSDPPIVFPGNLQGRNIRETGSKGAVLVTVRDRAVVEVRQAPLDVLRWARVGVDCTGAESLEDVQLRVREALDAAYAEACGLPLIVRVSLAGETSLAGALRNRSVLRDEVRALAAAAGPDLWLEKLVVGVRPPPTASAGEREARAPDALLALLASAEKDPGLAEAIAESFRPFLAARPAGAEAVGDGEGGDPEDGLGAAARRGEWAAVIAAAAAALPARLGEN